MFKKIIFYIILFLALLSLTVYVCFNYSYTQRLKKVQKIKADCESTTMLDLNINFNLKGFNVNELTHEKVKISYNHKYNDTVSYSLINTKLNLSIKKFSKKDTLHIRIADFYIFNISDFNTTINTKSYMYGTIEESGCFLSSFKLNDLLYEVNYIDPVIIDITKAIVY